MLKSARAPAGKVKRKNGNEAAVAISESNNGEAPNPFISHVAAVSWAATQTPETTLGNHNPTNAGFFSANQIEVFSFGSLATNGRWHICWHSLAFLLTQKNNYQLFKGSAIAGKEDKIRLYRAIEAVNCLSGGARWQ